MRPCFGPGRLRRFGRRHPAFRSPRGDSGGLGTHSEAKGAGRLPSRIFFAPAESARLLSNFRVHEVVGDHVTDDHVAVFNAPHVEIIDVDIEFHQGTKLASILARQTDGVATD